MNNPYCYFKIKYIPKRIICIVLLYFYSINLYQFILIRHAQNKNNIVYVAYKFTKNILLNFNR